MAVLSTTTVSTVRKTGFFTSATGISRPEYRVDYNGRRLPIYWRVYRGLRRRENTAEQRLREDDWRHGEYSRCLLLDPYSDSDDNSPLVYSVSLPSTDSALFSLCPTVVHLTWMAYDMVVQRTSPELSDSLKKFKDEYLCCTAAICESLGQDQGAWPQQCQMQEPGFEIAMEECPKNVDHTATSPPATDVP